MSGQEAERASPARGANQPIAGFFSEEVFRKEAGNRLFLARLLSKKAAALHGSARVQDLDALYGTLLTAGFEQARGALDRMRVEKGSGSNFS